MRILHCCLAAFYIDDYGYQENILPRIHRELGLEVEILASTETYLSKTQLGYVKPGSYYNSDNIKVTRLSYVKFLPNFIVRKLRLYRGITETLSRFRPDILFIHDLQFLSIYLLRRYAKKNKTRVYVDTHTDSINSARTFFSRNFLHKVVYRFCAALILPTTSKFYATLPLRGEFLKKFYKIPPGKIFFLPFGVDDSRINISSREAIRRRVRAELDIVDTDIVFILGGKIDKRKSIHSFLEILLNLIDQHALDNVKIILFGKADSSLDLYMKKLYVNSNIKNVGWVESNNIYKYLWAADVAVFPGTHSVLWEEAVGLGVPCIFKKWEGIEHINLGGNCIMFENVDKIVLASQLLNLISNPKLIEQMKVKAQQLGPTPFSYLSIAKQSIEFV